MPGSGTHLSSYAVIGEPGVTPARSFVSFIGFLTRPRRSDLCVEPAMA